MLNFTRTDNGLVAFSADGRTRYQMNCNLTRKGLHQLRVDGYDAGGFHHAGTRFYQSTNSRFLGAFAQKLNGADIDWDFGPRVKEITEPKNFGPQPPQIIHP